MPQHGSVFESACDATRLRNGTTLGSGDMVIRSHFNVYRTDEKQLACPEPRRLLSSYRMMNMGSSSMLSPAMMMRGTAEVWQSGPEWLWRRGGIVTYDDHGAGVVDAAGHEILEIFVAKAAALGEAMMSGSAAADGGGEEHDDDEHDDESDVRCNLPPSRAQNPMVRDAEFIHAGYSWPSPPSPSSPCTHMTYSGLLHDAVIKPIISSSPSYCRRLLQQENLQHENLPAPSLGSGSSSASPARANVPLIRIEGFDHEPCHRVPAFA